jgi:hypothetical protein
MSVSFTFVLKINCCLPFHCYPLQVQIRTMQSVLFNYFYKKYYISGPWSSIFFCSTSFTRTNAIKLFFSFSRSPN